MAHEEQDPQNSEGLASGLTSAEQQSPGAVDTICETCPWVEVGAIDEVTGNLWRIYLTKCSTTEPGQRSRLERWMVAAFLYAMRSKEPQVS